MLVFHSTEFKKKFKRSSQKMRSKIEERIGLFISDPLDPILDDHPLQREYSGYRSFNITGDVRLVYQRIDPASVFFVRFGTHHELYGS